MNLKSTGPKANLIIFYILPFIEITSFKYLQKKMDAVIACFFFNFQKASRICQGCFSDISKWFVDAPAKL